MQYPFLLKGRPYLRKQSMSLQLTSGLVGEQTYYEAALRRNKEGENLTLLSYSYCIHSLLITDLLTFKLIIRGGTVCQRMQGV